LATVEKWTHKPDGTLIPDDPDALFLIEGQRFRSKGEGSGLSREYRDIDLVINKRCVEINSESHKDSAHRRVFVAKNNRGQPVGRNMSFRKASVFPVDN
jgi:hypothetical protein